MSQTLRSEEPISKIAEKGKINTQNFMYYSEIFPPASVSPSSSCNRCKPIFIYSVCIHLYTEKAVGNRQYCSEQEKHSICLGEVSTERRHN